jgi:glutamate carboxypeptidase
MNLLSFKELEQLINVNSHTQNKVGVDQCGAIFCTWMAQLDFECTEYSRREIGNHLLFKSNICPNRPRILLLGHLDTVFPKGTFETFSQDDEWVYGPGVCDMKGGNIVALEALRAVKQSQGELVNIDMLLVSDEETGSDDSKKLSQQLATDYDACLVFEAAGKDHEVVVERKGVGTFFINLEGRAAHAGNHYSEGVNANLAAAHMILDLTALTNLDAGTTVNAGQMSGGIGANTISPKASITVEVRYTQVPERDRLLAALDAIVSHPKVPSVGVKLTGGIQRDVMQSSPEQAELVSRIEAILGYSLKTEKRGGVSDANIIASAGTPTLDGFGPYGDGDHTIHERALKQSFKRRIDEVTKILAAFNAAGQ